MKKKLNRIIRDQSGINTVEIVVLVAIAIGLALLFREQLFGFVNKVLGSVFDIPWINNPTPTP